MVENALKKQVKLKVSETDFFSDLEPSVLTTAKQRFCYLCENPLDSDEDIKTPDNPTEFVVVISSLNKEKVCKIHFSDTFKKSEWINAWESNDLEMFCCHCRRLVEELLYSPLCVDKLLDWATEARLRKLKELGLLNRSDLIGLRYVGFFLIFLLT